MTTRLILLVALALTAAPLGAQELALTGGTARSHFPELNAPATVAVHGRLPIEPFGLLELVVGGRWAQDSGRRTQTTCDAYWPQFSNCVAEPVVHTSTILQAELGLGATVPLPFALALRATVLGVRTTLHAGAHGVDTGRSVGNYYPEGTIRGWAQMGELVWTGLGDGMGLVARVRREPLDFHGCVTDVGVPYCGEKPMTTFEAGITLRFLDR